MSALNEEHLVLSVPLGGTEAAEKAHELSTASFFFFFRTEPDCEQLCRRSIKSQINSRLDGELMEGSQALGSVRSRVSKAPSDGGKYGVRTLPKVKSHSNCRRHISFCRQ